MGLVGVPLTVFPFEDFDARFTKDFEALAMEFKELYESQGIDWGWTIYQTITGSDLPLYVVVQGAKSADDYHANRARIKEVLGEEYKKLGKKVGAVVRRIEYKDGTVRPELSYPSHTLAAHDTHDGHGH